MDEPEATNNAPSPEDVESAVEFFSQGCDADSVPISSQDWRKELSVLEKNLNQNANNDDRSDPDDDDNISNIVSAIVDYGDKTFRHLRNDSDSRKKERKFSGITVFGLSKQASSRLIACLIPTEPLDGAVVRSFLLSVLTNSARYDANSVVSPVLRWTNGLLHYSLCSAEDLEPIYEAFFMNCVIKSSSKLIPLLCDILYKLTSEEKRLVTKWRVNALLRLQQDNGKVQALENLIKKFKDLRPDLIKKHLPKTKWTDVNSNGVIERRFAQLWSMSDVFADKSNVNPMREFNRKSKIKIWGAPGPTYSLTDQSNKRKRECVVPAVEGFVDGEKRQKIDKNDRINLNRCLTMGDVYDNLDRLQLPSQSLSLLGNRQTYFLLFINGNPTKAQEKFSMTLYRTLYFEFFSLSCAKGFSKRKFDLLSRINLFQEWLQESIPVVNRFLVEYLQSWNGRDFFLEVLRIVALIRIADFEEFNECILSKIRTHFNNTYTCPEQILVLTFLTRLCTHWIYFEYPRSKGNQSYSFLHKSGSPICDNPLESIASLVRAIENLSELGLTKLTYLATSDLNQTEKEMYVNVYVKEVIGLFTLMSRCLIINNIPIRPELPPAFVYFCLFNYSPFYLSAGLEFLAMSKHELIPMCQRRAQELERQKNHAEKKIAVSQVANLTMLNDVSKDILATLSCSQVFLDRRHSIFRRHWSIEDEDIRLKLNITSHPAIFALMIRFIDNERKTSKECRANLFNQLSDEETSLHQKYIDFLKQHLPILVDSLDTFQWRLKQVNHYRCLETASVQSATTSGVSSFKPSKSRSTRSRKQTGD